MINRLCYKQRKMLYSTIAKVTAQTNVENSDRLRHEGVEQLKRGNILKSIELLQTAVDMDSNNHLAVYNLGTAYYANRNIRKAKQLFYKVLQLRSDFYEVRPHLVELCVRQGHLDEALQNLNEMQKMDADNLHSISEQIERVTQLNIKLKKALDIHTKQTDFNTALIIYSELLQDCDLAETLYQKRSDCYLKLNQRNDAVDDLRHIISIYPENKDIMFVVADIYFKDGLFNEGMNWIKRCLKEDQANEQCRPIYKLYRPVQLNETKITKAINNNQWETCLDICESTLRFLEKENIPNALKSYLLSYKCRCSLHVITDQEEVVSLCTQALDLATELDPEVLLTRAAAHINLENWNEASADYQKLKQNGYTKQGEEGLNKVKQFQSNHGVDYYKILNVPRNADKKKIDRAFRKMAQLHHPDNKQTQSEKLKAEKKFRQLVQAKEILTDPEKRKRFDNGEDPSDNTQEHNPFDIFTQFQQGAHQSEKNYSNYCGLYVNQIKQAIQQ
ncbi:hypothetical protein GJ496_010211 [Pomphorhynchus laevis]|nr:hypothetical protein GJ496_010211 [Pomphorhynchus laevis]